MSPLTGRDSPPANDASEEAEEPMAVPEDLSANSSQQQNHRGDKGTRQPVAPVRRFTAPDKVQDSLGTFRRTKTEFIETTEN